jgi:hypothetical protein
LTSRGCSNHYRTFKYVHGSVTLDPKRAPAYTDRVLHLSRGPSVESTKYTSHELLWSDHLPVSSTYLVGARVADDTKRSEELIGVQCELDKLDELYRASLAIDETELDFGTLKYGRGEARELILRNTGRVPAPFSFRAPSPGKGICKPWFWPFPAAGVVGSGQELRVIVTADVGDEHAAALTGGEDMNDVLVLQVAGGKDSVSYELGTRGSQLTLPVRVPPRPARADHRWSPARPPPAPPRRNPQRAPGRTPRASRGRSE